MLELSHIMVTQKVELVVRMQAAEELITIENWKEHQWLDLPEDTRGAIRIMQAAEELITIIIMLIMTSIKIYFLVICILHKKIQK